MDAAPSTRQPDVFGWVNGLRYGALGLPLAFVALPLYVLLPHLYATQFGMALSLLGAVLLGARLFDALIDPLLGRWIDALYARSAARVLGVAAVACIFLAAGFAILFLVPDSVRGNDLTIWLIAGLLMTYVSFSAVSVAHQAWAARLGGSDAQRSKIVSWREALGLVGVVLASILPSAAGYSISVATFCVALGLGMLLWWRSQTPCSGPDQGGALGPERLTSGLATPFQNAPFRWLYAVFLLNGIASAVPATLLLFFVQDRLQAAAGAEGPLLAAYFVCAALSLPVWLQLVKRLGLERAWLVGMGLAIAVFVWAAALGTGDVMWFAGVCALSGVALGADLAIPSALLARIVALRADDQSAPQEGIYFGWWNFAAKLNLAIAAGLALPLLAWFGYTPGSRSSEALTALTIAYCLLPCLLKSLSGAVLWVAMNKGKLQ